MVALHLDPNSPKGGVENATQAHWEALEAFVQAADKHGFKLTLLMGADWPKVVMAAPGGTAKLAQWLNAGHELGFHHHSCGHAHPDGFRDIQGMNACRGESDRGSVRLAYEEVTELAAQAIEAGASPEAAAVQTAAQGPNEKNLYRSVEWQPEARFATGPQNDNTDGHDDHRFITAFRCTNQYGNSYSGSDQRYDVAELGHAQLDVGSFVEVQSANNLAALKDEIALLQGDHAEAKAVLGLVFHAREYTDRARATDRDDFSSDRAYLDGVLQLLADQKVRVMTARALLQEANPCSR